MIERSVVKLGNTYVDPSCVAAVRQMTTRQSGVETHNTVLMLISGATVDVSMPTATVLAALGWVCPATA
jgi:hypothetical protein